MSFSSSDLCLLARQPWLRFSFLPSKRGILERGTLSGACSADNTRAQLSCCDILPPLPEYCKKRYKQRRYSNCNGGGGRLVWIFAERQSSLFLALGINSLRLLQGTARESGSGEGSDIGLEKPRNTPQISPEALLPLRLSPVEKIPGPKPHISLFV